MATAKTQTVEEILTNIYSLQLVDSKIDEISILKGELPMEVSDLEDEISGLNTRLSKLKDDIQDLSTRAANHDTNIKESETLIERYEKQLDDVKNNREFDALTKEIELQKLEIELSNKRIREVKGTKEAKDGILVTSEEKIAKKQAELEVKKVELDQIIEKTEKEETKLTKKSDRLKKHIEARLLGAYTRIRERYKNGLAVVTVNREACGGCYNRIPPQMTIEIGQRKKVIACEHCGRVLIDDELAESLQGKKKKK